eukprot:m.12389 g.12389  ORF g.12389 m.12389 type:complete len:724 (-) comp9269_c0_seq1:212-2383(-)
MEDENESDSANEEYSASDDEPTRLISGYSQVSFASEEDDDDETANMPCAQVFDDIERLRKTRTVTMVGVRNLNLLGLVLSLRLEIKQLNSMVKRAWGLHGQDPMWLEFFVDLNYLDGASPTPKDIDVYQSPTHDCDDEVKSRPKLAGQIKAILHAWVSKQWNQLSNTLVAKAKTGTDEDLDLSTMSNLTSNQSDVFNALLEMGFSMEQAFQAVKVDEKITVDSAIVSIEHNACTNNLDASQQTIVNQITELGIDATHAYTCVKQHPHLGIDEAVDWCLSNPPDATERSAYDESENMNKTATPGVDPAKTENQLTVDRETEIKASPKFDSGFLVQTVEYFGQRLSSLNEFCVICDEPHLFRNTALIMPTCCNKAICTYGFNELNIGRESAEGVSTSTEVMNLLISITRACSKSHRRDLVMDPYPLIRSDKDETTLLFNPEAKNFESIEKLLLKYPTIESVAYEENNEDGSAAKRLKNDEELITERHLARSLCWWVVNSNTSMIQRIEDDVQLPQLKTKYQYHLLTAPPRREEIFSRDRQLHGTVFGFHGSSSENWHSMLRNGIISASGGKLQVNGAAYGPGVYLSPLASMSLQYSRVRPRHQAVPPRTALQPNPINTDQEELATNDKRQEPGKFDQLSVLALCEIVKSDTLNQTHSGGSIWVQQNEDHVVTRMLFVFDPSLMPMTTLTANFKSTDLAFEQSVKKAMRQDGDESDDAQPDVVVAN